MVLKKDGEKSDGQISLVLSNTHTSFHRGRNPVRSGDFHSSDAVSPSPRLLGSNPMGFMGTNTNSFVRNTDIRELQILEMKAESH